MKTERKLPLKDAWFIWFVLGVVMLNYPFLHIFNKNILVFGIPLTILYFFIGWPISIFVIYLFSIYLGRETTQRPPGENQHRQPTRRGAMIPVTVVALTSLFYFGILFGVAYYADRQRLSGRSLIDNPTVYSLSLAVYCTSWTFYGSVGRAATTGIDFLAIYLGPTLIAFSWWFLLRKIVRISKEQNITSIADFISSRYGNAPLLGAIVTIFAVLGIMPYIALQLKAVARTFDLLVYPFTNGSVMHVLPKFDLHFDSALVVAIILGLFGVLFGARHLDTSERHEGLVAAIALESLVKIVAFVAAGLFVTYGLFDGFGDIFHNFMLRFPDRSNLLLLGTGDNSYAHWLTMTIISMMAIMFLPRQFHIMVIENCREEHIRSAMWRFPAYMVIINLFVIPIALGGLLLANGDTQNADFFVITLPLEYGHSWLALLVFIGGFSASAGMVMVSSVALSTMILNHLLMPIILRIQTGAQNLVSAAHQPQATVHHRRHLPWLHLLPPARRIGRAGQYRAGLLCRRNPVRTGRHRRPLLAAGDPPRGNDRTGPRLFRLVLHPASSPPLCNPAG